jgi:flagellar protein FliS
MTATTTNPYLRTKVLTASPAELRMMLLDGAVKHLEQAKAGLERKDYETSYSGFRRCQNIVMELLNGLDPRHAPELCKRLSSLYTFMYTQLVTACSRRDLEITDNVLRLLTYERETWSMLMKDLAGENAAGAAAAGDVVQTLREGDGSSGDSSRSKPPDDLIGGRVSLSG